jgi:hypothetical protein
LVRFIAGDKQNSGTHPALALVGIDRCVINLNQPEWASPAGTSTLVTYPHRGHSYAIKPGSSSTDGMATTSVI